MKRIVLEFDGTIARQGTWPHIGELMPMTKQCLQKLKDNGYYIIISSTRNNPDLPGNADLKYFDEMIDFLLDNDVPFDIIDDGKSGKPVGDIYISHRAMKYRGDWIDTMYQIMYGRSINKKRAKREQKKSYDEGWLDDAGEV